MKLLYNNNNNNNNNIDWYVNPKYVDMKSIWRYRLESFTFLDLFLFANFGKLSSESILVNNNFSLDIIEVMNEFLYNSTSFNLFRKDKRFLNSLEQLSEKEGLDIINYIVYATELSSSIRNFFLSVI